MTYYVFVLTRNVLWRTKLSSCSVVVGEIS